MVFNSLNEDWTVEGVGVLTLFYYGDAANDAEPMYVALDDDAVVTSENADAALVTEWTQWDIQRRCRFRILRGYSLISFVSIGSLCLVLFLGNNGSFCVAQ